MKMDKDLFCREFNLESFMSNETFWKKRVIVEKAAKNWIYTTFSAPLGNAPRVGVMGFTQVFLRLCLTSSNNKIFDSNFFLFNAQFWCIIPVLLLIFYQVFSKLFKFCLKDLLSINKVTVKICPNFYSGLLKNFLSSFRSVFKFISRHTNYFYQKLIIVSNVFNLNFILCYIKLFTKIPLFSKFVPKFHKFYLKFIQT